ncbi:hypothetical protein KC327_g8603 [Hortaea werneckii]|nr:hypothetical protein KC350_g16077 [Hortaea werneckii]KAI6800371.1 hypothetical protein KC358_g15669 [Hortaea werneckii]KAI6921831.1 hypothetical protein KC341_g15722 [Hortaea werneckii]KAI6936522.1 hypothetical protein KC348_g5989 [Hortaea werneckii]KAI6955016.1 hypothetical protein KC321_g16016 [Hortaea werneckii]
MSATAAAAGPFPSHGLVRSDSSPQDSAVAQATAVAALQDATTAPTSATGSASPPADVPGGAVRLNDGRKRRASGQPGSRGVANLTPEQLAKKRANDREAQRAIRERTKNTIESLERRIKELESQQPFQELQRAIQDRDRAIQEAYDLRQKLSDITRVINGQGPSHAYPSSGHITISSSITNSSSSNNNRDHLMATSGADGYAGSSQEAGSHHQRQTSQQNLGEPSPASHPTTQGSPVSHSATAGAEAAQNYHPQQHYTSQPNGGIQKDAQSTPQRSLQHQNSGDRLGLSFLLDQRQNEDKRSAASTPTDIPAYARLPTHCEPTCPLDSLLADFIVSRRRLYASGAPLSEVLGPEYPSFTALIQNTPDSDEQPAQHPISKVLVDILSKFPDISDLPERVATLYLMFLTVRWCIHPCQESWSRLPDWLQPVAEQVKMGKGEGHPVWVDHVPWYVPEQDDELGLFDFTDLRSRFETADAPLTALAECFFVDLLTGDVNRPRMRALLASTNPKRFDEFFVPFSTTISVNWPASSGDVLVARSPHPGANNGDVPENLTITPEFESHFRNLSNWSLGKDFVAKFPDIVTEEVRIVN